MATHPTKFQDEDDDSLVEMFATLYGKLMGHATTEWIHTDISVAQIKIIFMLYFGGNLTVSQLAHQLGIGAPTASQLVQKLVKAGLAVRLDSPTDRRVVHVHLTEQGKIMARRMSGLHQKAIIAQWLACLSVDERIALAAILGKLTAAAETN